MSADTDLTADDLATLERPLLDAVADCPRLGINPDNLMLGHISYPQAIALIAEVRHLRRELYIARMATAMLTVANSDPVVCETGCIGDHAGWEPCDPSA